MRACDALLLVEAIEEHDSVPSAPTILVKVGTLTETVDTAESGLLPYARRFRSFQHAGELVRIVRIPERKGSDGYRV
jgi:hypothetical protein